MPGFPRHNLTPRIARMLRELEGTQRSDPQREPGYAGATKAGAPRREKTVPALSFATPATDARDR